MCICTKKNRMRLQIFHLMAYQVRREGAGTLFAEPVTVYFGLRRESLCPETGENLIGERKQGLKCESDNEHRCGQLLKN